MPLLPLTFLNKALRTERARLFYWAPLPQGLGIAAYFGWPNEPALIVVLALLVASAALALTLRESLTPRIIFLFFLGFCASSIATHTYGTPMLSGRGQVSRVEATIADVEGHKSGRRILLENPAIEKMDSAETPRRIRLVIPRRLDKQAGDLKPGQRFSGVAKLTPLSEPMVPGGFDFRRNAYFQGVGASGYALGKIEIRGSEGATAAATWFASLRQNLQAEIKKNLEGDKAGLAAILLTGDKTLLSEETATAMRAIGLAHLLAIAGLHVGLVAGIVFFLVRALLALIPSIALRFPIKKIAACLALLAIIFYTLQVGAPVPTRRSLVMTGIVLIAVMLDRISLSLRSIIVAAIVILVIWPQMLFHPAFQLSFAAVLGLISAGESFRKRSVHEKRGIARSITGHILALAGMSVVAMVATLPFCLYHFQEAEVYSVLSNTLAIPLTGFWLMPLCAAAEILWPLGLAEWPMRLLDPGLGLLIGLSHKITDLPGAHYAPPPMPVEYIIAATLGGMFFCLTVGRKRWLGLTVLALVVGLTFFESRPDIFISPDGLQTGWRDKEREELLITAEDKPDKFMAIQWAEKIGIKEEKIRYVDWEGKIKRKAGKGEEETSDDQRDETQRMISCDSSRCIGQTAGGAVAWILDASVLGQECAASHVIIISPLTNEKCPNASPRLLNHATFYNQGAQAIYATPTTLTIRAARRIHTLRPWD